MKGEGKMVFKSKLKWVGLVGLVLSAFSLCTHFLLARYTDDVGISQYQSAITIFSWRPMFENSDLSSLKPLYRRLWGPVRRLESVHPLANPRGNYAVPVSQTNGYIFVRIRGDFHEIRNSISDVVAISRLLNATLVIPEIQSATSSKGISSQFKSFAYLYNEDQFMAALAKDVNIVKTLPKNLKGARRKKEIPTFNVPHSASPYFYLHHVLPVLNRHSVVELVVSEGGCLQAILPPHLEDYQRLRCRVAFHALRFRQEVQELATKILSRLRATHRPFIAYDLGITRDVLAYYGCAELFQDVHTELIQHRRSWMLKRGIVKGKLTVNSEDQRRNGSCPLMPEEVGILLRAYGYSWDTVIYVSARENFGGQKKLIPLHAMFENVVDRTSLTSAWELNKIYGHEPNLVEKYPKPPPSAKEEIKFEAWKTSGPRPRPLPPPPARPKSYNIEGWWGWVAESDNEPETTVMELRTNAHKLLWEAIDYTICVEADVFIPGFDRDGKGHPNFASLVMGHRLYQSAASKTFRLDRNMDKYVLRTKRKNPQNECQNGDGRIGELSGKKARIDTKRLCEGEVIISDPALRKSIDDYEFESRNDVRRKYVLIGPCQPISHNFPRTQFGSANRCFQIACFMKWEWLEYSVSQDSAFCLWCYLFGDKKFVNEAFIKRGFRNWKKATEKFKEHVGTKGSAHSKARKLYIAFKEKQILSKNLPSRKEIVISVAPITAIAERKEAISGAAIVAAAEENPFVSNFFDNLSLIINTIGASCQRKDDLLQKQHEDMVERLEHDDVHSGRVLNQESGFGQLGDTRWGSHHKTIIRLLSMWSSVVEVLMNIYDDGSGIKSRGKVVGLIDKMESYEFVFIAHFMKLVLGLIDSLSQFLQKKKRSKRSYEFDFNSEKTIARFKRERMG